MSTHGIRERSGGASRIDELAWKALACPLDRLGAFYEDVAKEYGRGFANRLQDRMEHERAMLGPERAAREAADALGRPVGGAQ